MFFLVSKFDEDVNGTDVKRVRAELQKDQFNMNGFHPVEAPDNVSIDATNTSTSGTEVFTYQDLLNEKYETDGGILDLNSTAYDYVKYFDLVSGNIDLTAGGTRGAAGSLNTFLSKKDSNDGNGELRTNTVDISTDAPGSFSDFAVYWTVYTVNKSESDNQITKTYNRKSPDSIDAFISNDGGTTYQPATLLENVSFGSADNSVRVKFENPNSTRHYLGDFAFLY